jgi:hypothetical protein
MGTGGLFPGDMKLKTHAYENTDMPSFKYNVK